MLQIIKAESVSHNRMCITMLGDNREELLTAKAKDLAISAGTRQMGRCGFDAYGNWTYKNPPTTEHPEGQILTEDDMMANKLIRGGQYVQEFFVNGGL